MGYHGLEVCRFIAKSLELIRAGCLIAAGSFIFGQWRVGGYAMVVNTCGSCCKEVPEKGIAKVLSLYRMAAIKKSQ